jgi:hypothetical protein
VRFAISVILVTFYWFINNSRTTYLILKPFIKECKNNMCINLASLKFELIRWFLHYNKKCSSVREICACAKILRFTLIRTHTVWWGTLMNLPLRLHPTSHSALQILLLLLVTKNTDERCQHVSRNNYHNITFYE